MTMISVTHEMGFARRVADVVVFMHQGKVWETGPTAEVFANPRTAEFKQFVRPFVLGHGTPFFAGPRPPLRLVASDRIGEDTIRLTYVPA